ncbi:amelotin [Diceros bicornis minor]|nr:amelotin [Diceros bicornis minor]
METAILLFCLLGSTLSLPMQLSPALGLPPTKLVPDQATLLNQQQPNQVFPSLSLMPLTQMLTLGSDRQQLNPAAGVAPGAQTLPQQLQPQMLPVFVAQIGAQGTILSSEELPVARQIFTSLIFQPLFPGAILPTSQANPDVQNGILPAGQGGVKPAIQGTSESPFPTPSDPDDDLGGTTPAGIQRGTHTTKETTTRSPNVSLAGERSVNNQKVHSVRGSSWSQHLMVPRNYECGRSAPVVLNWGLVATSDKVGTDPHGPHTTLNQMR